MGVLDAMIIYLTIGAPFAVYEMTKGKDSFSRKVRPSMFAWLVWPAAAIGKLRIPNGPSDSSTVSKLEEIRDRIEQVAVSDGSYSSVIHVRNTFDTYVGLAIEAAQPIDRPPAAEILCVAGNDAGELALRCISRRERQKLAIHLVQARTEFTDLIAPLLTSPEAGDLSRRLCELAAHIEDRDMLDELDVREASFDPPTVNQRSGISASAGMTR